MDRDGTDDIIDPDQFEQFGTEGGDDGTDRTDQDRIHDGRGERFGGDRDQAGQGPVEAIGEIGLAASEDQREHIGRHHTAGCRHIGIGEDLGDGDRIGRRAERQLGGAVKAEPAEPEQECAQGRQRQRRGLHRAGIGSEASRTGTQQDGTGQGGPATGRVNQRRTGEVGEAELGIKPAAAPFPGALDRVDRGR